MVLLTDPTYRLIIGFTIIATAIVALFAGIMVGLYVIGVGLLVLMTVTERREEPWSKRLLVAFLPLFGVILVFNQI